MSLDIAVGIAVLVFALWGAMTGFARQLAQPLAIAAAFFGAGPLGRFFGQPIAHQLGASLTVGVVLATMAAFIVIYLSVRVVVSAIIRRLLADDSQVASSRDRLFGAGLGGFKAASLAYLGLCAATFLENNLVIAGKKYAITPKNSVLLALVREYNLLEFQQFSGTAELAKALKVVKNPTQVAKLQGDPDLGALLRDERFKHLLNHPAVTQAFEKGDLRGLLTNNQAVELIQDPKMMHHLEQIARTEHE